MAHPRAIGRNILVPLDGSALAELALPQAAALAAGPARVVLLRVVPPVGKGAESDEDAPPDVALSTARQELEDAAGRLYTIAPDLSVDVAVSTGEPGEEIPRFAERHRHDVIVMASFGHGGISRWSFGSVAGSVVRGSRVPVLVVRPQDAGESGFRRILVPLDGSLRAEQSLPIARALAGRLGVPVHLVAVIDPEQAGFPSAGTGREDEVWRQIRTALRAEAQETLVQAAASLASHGIAAEWEVLQGATVPSIRETTHPGDLIVLTSHARSNPPQWPQGSVGEQLVRTSEAPVMLARFVAPPDIVVPLSRESEPAWPDG